MLKTHTPVSHRKPSVKRKIQSHQCCVLYKLTKCTLYTNEKHKLKKKTGQQQNILNIEEFAHNFLLNKNK